MNEIWQQILQECVYEEWMKSDTTDVIMRRYAISCGFKASIFKSFFLKKKVEENYLKFWKLKYTVSIYREIWTLLAFDV